MTLVSYLILAAIPLGLVVVFAWWRERQWNARARAVRAILDHADALERELQECRARLREIPAVVATLPPSTEVSARATLAAEPQVQEALRDLLAHRLWLREHATDASLAELLAAGNALDQARRRLAEQLERLAEVRADLNAAREAQVSGGPAP